MEKQKRISFLPICISFIFLFNPNIAIIDLLPDFVGYLILSVTLLKLGDINETIGEALKGFRRMIFIDAGKLLAILWVFGISVTTERNSSLLLWSFTFGVLEIIMVIPAFVKLFKGLVELGYLYENISVIGSRGSRTNPTDKIKVLTVLFVILKAVMSFLPELADLTSTEYYENQGMTNLYRYIGIMRFLAFVPVAVLGIYWLARCIFYFSKISRDKSFVQALSTFYVTNVLSKRGIFVKRNVRACFAILITALVVSADLRFENVNIFPDIICAVLFVIFFAFAAKKLGTRWVIPILFSSCFVITSALSTAFEVKFFKGYTFSAIYRDTEAFNAYTVMTAASILNTVIFAITAVLGVMTLMQIIKPHTGVLYDISSINLRAQRNITDTIQKDLRKTLVLCFCGIALYVVTDIAYALFIKDYGIMTFISTLGLLICVGAFIKASLEITEAVDSRYLLESTDVKSV